MGREVIACAPTTSAAEVLRGEGFSNATTLADLLKNAAPSNVRAWARRHLIVDEAGIASTRQARRVCYSLTQRQNARLVIVGDSRQHSGVEGVIFLRSSKIIRACKPAN